MPKAKPLSKEQIIAAMGKTKSNRAAARYLNVSYIHYKGWAKFYKDEEVGLDLFEKHKNQSGKGIPKFLNNGKKDPALLDVIEGRIDPSHFNPQKIKYRLLQEGYLKEECSKCGFHERRVLDYKMPLIMHFKDGNKQHYKLDNLEMLCYNCFFLYYGDVFSEKDLEQLEDHKSLSNTTEAVNLELDDYHQQRLKELGLYDSLENKDDDPYSLVSRV
jgi:transposase